MKIGGIADYAYSNGDITRIISGTAALAKRPERLTLSRLMWDIRASTIIDVLFPRLSDIKSNNNRIIIFSRGVLTREITQIISGAAASPVANSRPE